MAYSSEIYAKASLELEARRRAADNTAQANIDFLRFTFPQYRALERKFDERIAELSLAALSGDSDILEINKKCEEAQLEKEKFLEDHAVKRDFLAPKYYCEKCGDTGWLHGIRCNCFRELCCDLAREDLAESIGNSDCSFENFRLDLYPDNGTESAENPRYRMSNTFEMCKKYADEFSKNPCSLLFLGSTGLGKTHLSIAIAKSVVYDEHSVIYSPAQKLVSNLEKEHFSSGEGDGSYLKYSGCDLLIIDDLGAEFSTRFTSSVLENLINERICNDLPTIISTNCTLDDIKKLYSERMYSRIAGCFKRFMFIGKDIRIKKALYSSVEGAKQL